MLAGSWVNIVGPHALQNALLANFIESETTAFCETFDSSKNKSIRLKSTHRATLTLLDSSGDDTENALVMLGMCRETGPIEQNIAFINVPHNSDLVNYVGPPDINGLFFINTSKDHFIKGLDTIFNGELWFPRKLMEKYLMNNRSSGCSLNVSAEHEILTTRETQILNLLATGAKNSDIAADLCLSVHTIKTHIYHIYKKLDVENRTQAVRWASINL